MTSNENLLAEKAKLVNDLTDELNASFAKIDLALKALNLGIETWYRVPCQDFEIGYAKVSNTWGLSLRLVIDPDRDWEAKEWHICDAPRVLRLAAVEHIPGLFEEMTKEANALTRRIETALANARVVVSVFSRSR
jgi:hypothetical protein